MSLRNLMRRIGITLLGTVIVVLLLVSVSGCGKKAPGPAAPDDAWSGVTRSTPDEHGVICYRSRRDSLSCVKVKSAP